MSSGARVETQIVGYQIHAPLTPPRRIVGFHHLPSEAEDDPGAQSEHPSWPKADPGLLEGTAPSLPPTPPPRQLRAPHSLALGAVAVHAVLNGLVAGLAQGPAGHLHSQASLRAPLDGPLQPPAVPFRAEWSRETGRETWGGREQRDQSSG